MLGSNTANYEDITWCMYSLRIASPAEAECLFCSRPRSVADVAHQEEVVRALQKAMESSNVSCHLLSQHIWDCISLHLPYIQRSVVAVRKAFVSHSVD